MTENIVLEFSYVDSLVIDVEYDDVIERYLQPETQEVFGKDLDVEIIPHYHKMPKGFAIISYKVESRFSKDYRNVQYELFYGDNAKDNKELSREEAQTLISIHNLELVQNNKYGRVWE